MTLTEATKLTLGQKVVVRTAHNELLPAMVAEIPTNWRDRNRNKFVTSTGQFPKCWVLIRGGSKTIPWPVEDVFLDLPVAQAVVEEHRS